RRPAWQPAGACRVSHPFAKRSRARDRGKRTADRRYRRLPGGDGLLLAGRRGGGVKVKIWGARGSIPAPGPETTRYGGNTSCVQLTLSDGSVLVLDAGTGIRSLGTALRPMEQPLHILLTHLHLD